MLCGALAAGARETSPATAADRAEGITERFRCPTCRSQSVADSDAPAARFIKEEVLRRVEGGESDEQIESYLVGRYGEQIRLDPSRRGFTGLVWLLPLAAATAAIAGLVVAFRRWSPRGRRVSDADRALVEEALRERSDEQ
ncbi:MAG: cytochrome c-type biogenesis protein CcmH [Actinobacteria bacterium]|nr:cytochrome c-type biogenesis protein CcmH [Actinomycetota bacterium]